METSINNIKSLRSVESLLSKEWKEQGENNKTNNYLWRNDFFNLSGMKAFFHLFYFVFPYILEPLLPMEKNAICLINLSMSDSNTGRNWKLFWGKCMLWVKDCCLVQVSGMWVMWNKLREFAFDAKRAGM